MVHRLHSARHPAMGDKEFYHWMGQNIILREPANQFQILWKVWIILQFTTVSPDDPLPQSSKHIKKLQGNCKVIRIGKRVQPDISKARQQVNIDRPAYNKTDKQCRTRTTITARLPDG